VLEQGRQNAPQSIEIALAYAELLADTSRAAEGRTLALYMAKTNPQEAAPLVTLGFIEEKRKNPEKAEVYYQQALVLESTDFMANFRAGKLYFKQAEESRSKQAPAATIKELQEKSMQYAEMAARANPKHFGNNRILLELYNALGLQDKAQLLRTEMN
jgi:tetratricopeptide (TPR) repeat protein